MPTLVAEPTRIRAAGTKPKLIDEFIGRVNTKTAGVSVAHMRSPQGWEEPGQTPEFDEFTLVLKGVLHVKHKSGEMDVAAGQATSLIAASGCSIRRPLRGEQSTLRFACRRFPWRQSTATSESFDLSLLKRRSVPPWDILYIWSGAPATVPMAWV